MSSYHETFARRAESNLFYTGVPRSPLIITRAQGTKLYDVTGKEVLDFTSGQLGSLLGHCHPEIVATTREWAAKCDHLQSNMITEPVIRLAERLNAFLPDPLNKSFLLNTGSETLEAAIKMAKVYTGKFEIVAFSASYHGLTAGVGSATFATGRKNTGPAMPGQLAFPAPYAYRSPFRKPSDRSWDWETEVAYGWSLIDSQSVGSLAAFVMEPILSTGGVLDMPPEYMQRMAAECKKRGMLLIADEAVTGGGRTGQGCGFEFGGIVPDIVALSKALGAGLPLGSVTSTAEIERGCRENGFMWFSTHLNDPLTAAVGDKVLEIVVRDDIMGNAARRGEQLRKGLLELQEKYWCIGDVRGRGLLQGIEVISDKEAKTPGIELGRAVCDKALELGLSCNVSMLSNLGGVFRIAPPAVVTEEDIELGLRILDDAFGFVLKEKGLLD